MTFATLLRGGLPAGLLVAQLCGVAMAQQPVQVHETQLTLATYDEGLPSPNPQFPQFFADEFPNYPYTIRTPVNTVRHMTPWRTIVIENEYLSCRVMPDLGGHMHGCTDKISGREVFYANPALRRGNQSVRGSFIATGIESSFPYAHSRVSSSPVDFAWTLSEGVGRVVVEDTDRVSGMQWRDEFILRPGSTVLEQKVTLYNGGPARRSYHWWANAAVALDDPHLRFYYPVKWMLPHGDDPMIPWPVSNGTDLSDAANFKKPIGLFGHGSNEPWMAVYKPASRSGLIHYANPAEVKGKKVWVWADSDKFVKENLTENFPSYVEMQAGVFETQPEFAFLRPGEAKTFSHFWIPVRDLGGVSRATQDLILNVGRNGAAGLIELSATRLLKGVNVRVSDGGKTLLETQADLDPKKPWTGTFENAPPAVTVDVLNSAGTTLLHHREGEIDALPFDRNAKNPMPTEPKAPPADGKGATEADYLARGDWHERQDQLVLAWNDYQSGIARLGKTAKLALAAGRIAVALYRTDDALPLLYDISADGKNSEAAYYYGVAVAATPLYAATKNAFTNAARDPAYSAAARIQLALLEAREWNVQSSLDDIQAAAADPNTSVPAGALEVALLRRAGQPDRAKKRLDLWLAKDPADNMLRVEKIFLGAPDDPSLWSHLAGDPERVLNLAEAYESMGGCDDALRLLDRKYPAVSPNEAEPGAVLPQDNALVAYYRGYCRLKTGKDPKPDFAAASALPTLYVFPHRGDTARVLETAIIRNDHDANAHSLLGDFYFDSGLTDQAITEWRKALALKKDIPALHRNLGRALLEIKQEPAAALPVLQEGLRLHPDDPELGPAVGRLGTVARPTATPGPVNLSHVEAPPSGPQAASAPLPAAAQVAVSGDVATRALLSSPLEPDTAIALFSAANFPRDKQPNEVRRAYIEVQLQRLLTRAHSGRCREALDAIETLGDENQAIPFTLYGFGPFMKAVHFQYYLGVIENLCGDDKAAKRRWGRLTKPAPGFDSADDAFPYLALQSAGENGWQQKLAAAIQTVHAKAGDGAKPELLFIEGSLLIASGKRDEGDALLQKAMKSSDPFVQYLSLTAMRENSAKPASLLR